MTDSTDLVEPWQLEYFVQALARGACLAEAAGCGGILDMAEAQLQALSNREDVRIRLMGALRERFGIGDPEYTREKFRAEAMVQYAVCVSRKDQAAAHRWLTTAAKWSGLRDDAPQSKSEYAGMTDDEIRAEFARKAKAGKLRVVSG